MRVQGITDIKNVRFCILEPGGKLSFFEEEKGSLSLPVITDGETELSNMTRLGITEELIIERLKADGKDIADVFLMTANDKPTYNIIYKEEKNENNQV